MYTSSAVAALVPPTRIHLPLAELWKHLEARLAHPSNCGVRGLRLGGHVTKLLPLPGLGLFRLHARARPQRSPGLVEHAHRHNGGDDDRQVHEVDLEVHVLVQLLPRAHLVGSRRF